MGIRPEQAIRILTGREPIPVDSPPLVNNRKMPRITDREKWLAQLRRRHPDA